MTKQTIAILDAAREPMAPRLLAFDVTPAGLIGDRSLRLAFKHEWARIRARHFKENAAACMLCHTAASINKIDAHEVYSFPSPEIVKLERILFVCKACHDTIHLERARKKGSPGYVQFLEQHYCKINGVSEGERIADYKDMLHRSFAIREFYGGGEATPKMDFGPYQSKIDVWLNRKRKPVVADNEDGGDDDSGFEMYPDHECPWDAQHSK